MGRFQACADRLRYQEAADHSRRRYVAWCEPPESFADCLPPSPLEDEKVSLDELQERVAEFEDYVQSSDVAAMQSTFIY